MYDEIRRLQDELQEAEYAITIMDGCIDRMMHANAQLVILNNALTHAVEMRLEAVALNNLDKEAICEAAVIPWEYLDEMIEKLAQHGLGVVKVKP